MEDKKKIYIGNGKTITGQYGTFRSASICLSDIPDEHKFEYNGKTYVKVNINDKQEVNEYGKNVSITVDTWKPEQKREDAVSTTEDTKQDDIPF